MRKVHGRRFTPSQQRRIAGSRDQPFCWSDLLMLVWVVGTIGGGVVWVCCSIVTWVHASPTMKLMLP